MNRNFRQTVRDYVIAGIIALSATSCGYCHKSITEARQKDLQETREPTYSFLFKGLLEDCLNRVEPSSEDRS